MDISKTLQELKKRPEFTDNVGMILIHNGVVRNWSRNDRTAVTALEVTPDREKIEALRQEYLQREGIFEIIIEAFPVHSDQGMIFSILLWLATFGKI